MTNRPSAWKAQKKTDTDRLSAAGDTQASLLDYGDVCNRYFVGIRGTERGACAEGRG